MEWCNKRNHTVFRITTLIILLGSKDYYLEKKNSLFFFRLEEKCIYGGGGAENHSAVQFWVAVTKLKQDSLQPQCNFSNVFLNLFINSIYY